MDVLTNGRSRLGFGLFEADLSARELYRRGALVHVQEQPFQVLAMLLARPGELVTREELRKKLWPGDTLWILTKASTLQSRNYATHSAIRPRIRGSSRPSPGAVTASSRRSERWAEAP